MHDCERGARHISATAERGNETFDEQRFTTAQISLESQDRSDFDMLCKLPPDRLCLSRTVGNECSHLVIFDCRLPIFD
jgi:hypothetical protein